MDSGLQSGGEGRSLCHWPAMDCCLFWRYVWVSPTATDRSMLGQILVFVIGVTQGSGTSRCGHGRSRCLSLAKFLFISFDNHHASHQHDMVVHLSGGHLPEASFVVVFGTPRFKELSILTSRIWCHSEKSPFPFLEARARLFVCLGATGTLNKDAHFCRRWLWAVLADISGLDLALDPTYIKLMTFCSAPFHLNGDARISPSSWTPKLDPELLYLASSLFDFWSTAVLPSR